MLSDVCKDQRTLDELKRYVVPEVKISRIADVTGLDCIGMPVFQAIRPLSKNYCVSQGKGLSSVQASISAIMESVEMFHAEEMAVSEKASIRSAQQVVTYDIRSLQLNDDITINDTIPLEWTSAVDLYSAREELIPKEICSMDLTVTDNAYYSPFRKTSNGLAAGLDRNSAMLHGLYEVLERHIVYTHLPVDVDLVSITGAVRDLIRRLKLMKIDVRVKYFANDYNLPCFKVQLLQEGMRVGFTGTGCDSSRNKALEKAFAEAVQSRLTLITGSRDDIRSEFYATEVPEIQPLPRAVKLVTMNHLSDSKYSNKFDELNDVLATLFTANLRPKFKDLSRNIGVYVVFILIPSLTFKGKH